ncbi:MAG: hypothetical protein ABI411_09870 [Tahibacter sp.]
MNQRSKSRPARPILLCAIAALASPAWAGHYPKACLDALRSSPQPVWEHDLFQHEFPARMSLSAVGTDSDGGYAVTAHEVSMDMKRYPCGGDTSLVVLRIADPLDAFNMHTFDTNELMFPRLSAEQEGMVSRVRGVSLYNKDNVYAGDRNRIGYDTSYALEIEDGHVDLNLPFTLIASQPEGKLGDSARLSVAPFRPTPETSPDAYGARPVNGRYAGNYFDPDKPGEGVTIEIGDVPDKEKTHYLQFSWFSYDSEGKPFWISGGTNFLDGDKHLRMPVAIRGGGRFGGARRADALTSWGTVEMEFSDCSTLSLDYSANADLPQSVPGGQGHLQWQRLTGISGFACN